jgi:hypothetical protein
LYYQETGTCHRCSLDVSILGKAAVLHSALTPFCGWGLCPSQPADYWAQLCFMSGSHRLLIICSPQVGMAHSSFFIDRTQTQKSSVLHCIYCECSAKAVPKNFITKTFFLLEERKMQHIRVISACLKSAY